MSKKTNIVVTGVGGRSVGHQILQSILMHRGKYNVIATDADPFSFGLFQVAKRYIVPKAYDRRYITAIKNLIVKESVHAILPGTEAEVYVLSKHRLAIEGLGCKLIINPTEIVDICSNKYRLYKWLSENEFGTPKTVQATEWEDLVSACNFPIVAKPTENSGASRNVAILKNEKEVAQYISDTRGSEVIFQEYVGHADEEYTVGVLISKKGKIFGSIVIHRKLTGLSLGAERNINGKTFALSTGYSQGFIIQYTKVQKVCERLAIALGMRGPANIQCRIDNGEVKIFEVHPRFSGTSYIRALAGFNEPDILLRNFLFDEDLNTIDYKFNVAVIRAFENKLVPISELNNIETI